ncbi:MAG TPA: NAD(P)-dependent oxidoreductase [Terriglobales bacterium]|nr:NAD(P)-dependent oxidoreductase [Terriglobales bacterium]
MSPPPISKLPYRSSATSRELEFALRRNTKMKIGFIGLGAMGSAMARRLIEAGHELTVYNRTRSRAEELRKLGAKVADTPGQAAGAEVVFTMLADDHAVELVVFGADGILHSLSPGKVHVSSSTISVSLSRRLAAAHGEMLQNYIAAPVFGRPEAAAAAKLFIVAAGAKDQIGKCRPLFDIMGQKTFVLDGGAPAANVVKLTGNFLISTVIEALSEALALVRKSGIDPNQYLDILTNSLFSAPVYKTYGALVASQEFQPVGFKLPLGLKDNRLLLSAAEEKAVPMPMASLIRDKFIAAIAEGLSESDWSAISSIAFRDAGL